MSTILHSYCGCFYFVDPGDPRAFRLTCSSRCVSRSTVKLSLPQLHESIRLSSDLLDDLLASCSSIPFTLLHSCASEIRVISGSKGAPGAIQMGPRQSSSRAAILARHRLGTSFDELEGERVAEQETKRLRSASTSPPLPYQLPVGLQRSVYLIFVSRHTSSCYKRKSRSWNMRWV